MNRNLTVAAAVAAVLASTAAMATQPSPASAASPAVSLYIAGSSAAKNAILGSLETTLCGGSYSLFSSTGNTNFFAVSCTPDSSTGLAGANGSNIYTVWYRAEGGSVVGALPLVTGSVIDQLTLSGASGSAGNYTVAVSGSSAANGIDDSFLTGTANAAVQLGITDVEPGALIKDNYPSAYLTSVYGKASAVQLAGLSAQTIFDQVFGVFVNTNSSLFTAAEKAGQGTATASLSIGKSTITNILQNNIKDWVKASDTTGTATIATGSLPITIINREQGSGSRAATSIFFMNDNCQKGITSIKESTAGTADYFSTGNVLAAANTIPGAITYASIDNAGSTSFPNLTLVAVNGVQPSILNAAAGIYDDWYEATAVTGSGFSSLSTDTQDLANFLIGAWQAVGTTVHTAQVLANPQAGNTAALPVTSTASTVGGKTIYVNPYSRSGVSCNIPTPQY